MSKVVHVVLKNALTGDEDSARILGPGVVEFGGVDYEVDQKGRLVGCPGWVVATGSQKFILSAEAEMLQMEVVPTRVKRRYF